MSLRWVACAFHKYQVRQYNLTFDILQDKKLYVKENTHKGSSALGNPMGLHNSNPSRDTISGQRATIAKICEEGKIYYIIKPHKVWITIFSFVNSAHWYLSVDKLIYLIIQLGFKRSYNCWHLKIQMSKPMLWRWWPILQLKVCTFLYCLFILADKCILLSKEVILLTVLRMDQSTCYLLLCWHQKTSLMEKIYMPLRFSHMEKKFILKLIYAASIFT